MSFKIPCGGFKLDENSFSLDENGVLSIPKPLTYDYMPEGYPKKDGWSVEWDGNIDGKINVAGTQIYKFSDRVLTYEEFLSAQYVLYEYGVEQDSGMVSDGEPKQEQLSDAVSRFECLHGGVHLIVVSEDNAEAEGMIFPTKGLYAFYSEHTPTFKLIKETITPMSTDFLPPMKNLSVVFSRGSDRSMPDSCNVTYDELRGWIENGIPVFAIYKIEGDDGSVSSVRNIVNFEINIDSISVYYLSGSSEGCFKYNSDGTFSGSASS